MDGRVRLGVLGVGMMGELHCRAATQIRELELVGVYDTDGDRATAVARQYECAAFGSRDELFASIDAVSIVTPTSAHADAAVDALASGRHVLIEKPIADRMDAAERVVEAARRSRRVCLVGHIERYNATFGELKTVLAGERPIAIAARRLNYFAPRITDADVCLDLLIHDVDLAVSLAGEAPSSVHATGMRVLTDQLDHVEALLGFPGGSVASLTASRMTEDKIRRVHVIVPGRYIVADLLRRTLTIHQRASAGWQSDGPDVKFRLESVTQQVQVPAVEPLQRELADLAGAIREGRPPAVTAEDGLRALDLVLRVRQLATPPASAARAEG